MIVKLINYLSLYKLEVFKYLITGLLVTLVNLSIFFILVNFFKINIFLSNLTAFFLTLILAFFLNRHFVFNAKNFKLIFSKQLKSFINLRLVTGVFDLFFVFIMVEYLSYSANYIKPVSSAIVIILNYLISKLIVFI